MSISGFNYKEIKKKKTHITIYKTICEKKKEVKSKFLFLHNLGILNKIHIASSLIKSKIL